MQPSTLENVFAEVRGPRVGRPVEGTCRQPDGMFHVLDYAIMDVRGQVLLQDVETLLDWDISPHRPVRIDLRADPDQMV